MMSLNDQDGASLKEIRDTAFSIFSSLPLFESSQVKFNDDLKSFEPATFTETYDSFMDGFAPLNQVHKVGGIEDPADCFDKDLLKPLTGFGAYCLAFFGKIVSIDCKNTTEKGSMRINAKAGLCLEPVFINVPKDVSAELLLSFEQDSDGVSFDLIRVKVGEGSSLKLFLLFKGALGRRFVDLSAGLEKNGRAEIFTLRQDGLDFVYRSNHTLKGEGADFKESAIASLRKKEKADMETIVAEEAAGVSVNVEVRAIANDNSKVGLNGMIKVNKSAVKSRSRYSGHCLKLSAESRADVRPNLEIEALDIQASHAASVSPLDEEKLFYLEARGMSPDEAKKEISLGFLAALLKEHQELAPLAETMI
jgi:hypothetical protein